MKTIKLTKGYSTTVDDEDFDWASQWKWCATTMGRQNGVKRVAAVRRIQKGKPLLLLHRALLERDGPPLKRLQVDHVDHNALNNQRANLRVCSNAENSRNSRKWVRKTSSRFKGVSWKKRRECWEAYIHLDGVCYHLGHYHDEEDAARAYDRAAVELFGEYANLNLPEENAA